MQSGNYPRAMSETAMIELEAALTEYPIVDELVLIGGKSGVVMPLLRDEQIIPMDDLIWNICGINRFAGGVDYSVGQHALLVHSLCPSYLKRQALVHDLHEGLCGDVPSPVKEFVNRLGDGAWSKMEGILASRVRRFMGVPLQLDPEVHRLDMVARGVEVAYLMPQKTQSAYNRYGVAVRRFRGYEHHFVPRTRQQTYYRLTEMFKLEGML